MRRIVGFVFPGLVIAERRWSVEKRSCRLFGSFGDLDLFGMMFFRAWICDLV